MQEDEISLPGPFHQSMVHVILLVVVRLQTSCFDFCSWVWRVLELLLVIEVTGLPHDTGASSIGG